MFEIADETIEQLEKDLRVTNSNAYEEIKDLANACIHHLDIAGVYVAEMDPLVYQAVKLYCKWNYGYDDDTERFEKAYSALRDSMALSGDYGTRGDGE